MYVTLHSKTPPILMEKLFKKKKMNTKQDPCTFKLYENAKQLLFTL